MRGQAHHQSICRELNKRREKVETYHLLKEGKVPIYKTAGEGIFNYKAELAALQARIGESFDPVLLVQAFITQSHVEQEKEKHEELGLTTEVAMRDNTDLVIKGTKCISETLTQWLRAALPYFPEEGVQAVVGYLTKEEMLADVGFHLGLRELVLCKVYPPTREDLARCFAAMVGALAFRNEDRAQKFVVDLVASQLAGKDLNELWDIRDPMGVLITVMKESGRSAPESRLLWKSGPGSILASYWVGLYVDKELVGESSGETLDIAEEMAARDALRNVFHTTEHSSPLPWARLPHTLLSQSQV